MRGTLPTEFALIFAVVSLAPRPGHAETKREVRIFAGGEIGGTFGDANQGTVDLAANLGFAYAPTRFVSFGIVGAYGIPSSGSCEVLLSGSGGGCSGFHPYRLTAEVEVDPFTHTVVDPFFVADAGIFGQHDSVYGNDPKVAPTFGGGAGLHFFPVDALSVDLAFRILYADFPSYEFGKVWAIFSVGVTPRIAF